VTNVDFTWHGGEVTLLSPEYLRKALWLQEQFRRPGQRVSNAVQTNATNLTDEWIDLFRRYQVSAGVSLDGPPEVHDRRRVDRMGRATSTRVRDGLARLRAAGISHGVLMVVDEDVIEVGAQRLLDYFVELDVRNVATLNVIPDNAPVGSPQTGAYLPWTRWIEFLRELFHLWWPRYAERVVLRELADLTGKVGGRGPQLCIFAGDCFGAYLTIEPNGDVAACDKYIDDPDYRFGNLLRAPLAEILRAPAVTGARATNNAAADGTRDCPWFDVCRGACPHDRYLREQRTPGWDESCCGYAPLLEDIAARLPETGMQPVHPARGAAVHPTP
jgi:uncharacterized protein